MLYGDVGSRLSFRVLDLPEIVSLHCYDFSRGSRSLHKHGAIPYLKLKRPMQGIRRFDYKSRTSDQGQPFCLTAIA